MSQVQAQVAAQAPVPRMLQWLRLLPGTGLSGVIALAATFVSTLHGGPQLLFALFFGVAFHFLSQDARAKPGIEFCARGVLRPVHQRALVGARRIAFAAMRAQAPQTPTITP